LIEIESLLYGKDYGKEALEKTSRGSTLKIAGCLFVAAFLQTTLVQQVPISVGRSLGHINWLLLVVIYLGLQRDPVKALLTGVAAGIFQDAFSFGRGIGISGLAFVLAAYVADRIATVIMVDNLIFRFAAVAAGSLVSSAIHLVFYRLLNLDLPAWSSGPHSSGLAATVVFDLIANLIGFVLLNIALDRVLQKASGQKIRRIEARRRPFRPFR
jgi:rod shape-determining protein MreD